MRINQQALVAHSVQQMFSLVMDVESYPEFLPYCKGAEILRQDDGLVEARLDLSRGPVSQSFATRNRFQPDEFIELELLEGPFSRLSGLWAFTRVSDAGSRVALQLDFELRGPLKFIATPLVSEVANRMLQSMIKEQTRFTPEEQVMSAETIHIEVAYALPDRQKLMALQVPTGTTAREAVKLSSLGDEFPEINPEDDPLGIFGQALGVRGMPPAEEYQLRQGDRIEIYRPLIADPKEVRKQRAKEAELRRQERSSSASGSESEEGA